MSNLIQIKRGLKTSLPNLEVGEFGLATDTNELFIGTPTGNELVNINLNEMAYFDYAGSFYGAKYNLLANAWQDMKDSETVLFDIPLTLVAPNQEMGGMTIDLYVGTNGQLQALYDACANETIPLPVDEITRDVYYVNNVATFYAGDVSGDVGFPIPLYNFGVFGADDNTSFLIGDLTPLSMGLGLVLAKFVNVSIPNNNIVIQQGFEFENESGIIIPNSVTSIGEFAFYHWTSNNQPLIIPQGVTSIGNDAFRTWEENNQPLIIPNSVINIGSYAFRYWTSNNQPLTIPNSVTEIGDGAFEGWTSAKEFIMESETPPTITSSSFDNTNNAPFYVPNGSVTAYKTATNWVDLADRIFPMSDRTQESGGGIPEAPIDDKLYGRKNAAWSEIISGGGGGTVEWVDVENKPELYNKTEINSMLDDKVDKVTGKGLSANDFTNNDKNKLDGIEAGAEVNPYSKTQLDNMFDDKVDKVSGMGLSSNDFTTTEKNKLSGIQAGAQVNAVTTVAGRTGAVVLAKADVGLGSVQNYAIASKTEAESGTANDLYMTPLRTKELITNVMGDIESALDAILGV